MTNDDERLKLEPSKDMGETSSFSHPGNTCPSVWRLARLDVHHPKCTNGPWLTHRWGFHEDMMGLEMVVVCS